MRILTVRAEAFGPFEDRSLDLAPGMNVVIGPNEIGKSSWHAAIFAGLCGLRRIRGGQTVEDRDFAARYKPWNLERWAVRVQVALDDGRQLEIRQDLLGESESTVTDLVTGRPAKADLIREGAPDGATLLGLSRRTLPATLAVRQAEILRLLENPGELQEQLQRAASTGGADATAKAAIDAIRAFHLERVGPLRQGSRRPLMSATQAIPRRQAELEAAKEAHEGYLALLQRRQEAEILVEELESEAAAVRRELDRRDLAGLRRRVERARSLAGRFPNGEPPNPDLVRQEVTEVAMALRDFASRPPVPELPSGRTASEIEARLAELPEAPAEETEPAAEAIELREAYQVARHTREAQQGAELPTGRKPHTGGADAGELRRLAVALEVPEVELDPDLEHRVAELRLASRRLRRGGPGRALLGAGAAAALIGIALLAIDVKLVGLGAVGVGMVLLALGWRRLERQPQRSDDLSTLEARLTLQREAASRSDSHRQAAETRARELGLGAEPSTLRRLAGELETFEVVARERERWEERLARLRAEEAAAAAALRSTLAPKVDEPEESDPATLWQRYVARCRERAVQADAAERRPGLLRELATRQALESAAAEDLRARATAAEALTALAGRYGVSVPDAETLAGQLQARLEAREADLRQAQEDREAWVQLQEILAGRRLADLEADLESGEAELAAGTAEVAADLPEDLRAHCAVLEARLAAATREYDRLGGQVVDRGRSLASVAEAEEALAQAEAEVARIESVGAILGRTLGYLEAARDKIQRDIAPRIATAIGSRLAEVTDGRYAEALVDPATLEVRVRAADGQWRDARHLSHGTAEQVYLLLRLALAEVLVTTGESAPLLLDDVTVQSDATRTRAILELLHEVSGERQIVFFSQEEEVLSWARERLQDPSDRLIELGSAA